MACGYCLLELVFASSLAVVISAIAVPSFLASLAEQRTAAAVRYVSTHCARARMEAIKSGHDVAIRFTADADGVAYAMYADGNGDGVRTRDIEQGIDTRLLPPERLSFTFPGVEFAVPSGLPPVDAGALTDGDPLKMGASNLLSYSPAGTSTSGSLYIRGANGTQYVPRLYGETGKSRALRFHARSGRWVPA